MPLEVKALAKSYNDIAVLEDFSLTLSDGETVALMGPSGSGKTTLLRLLAGLERPDRGTIQLPGSGRVSMVFQEDRLLPSLTARGNIMAVLSPGKGSEALAKELLHSCGLGKAADKRPEELSGGMRRRVAIARAVAYGGDLLLLDEPFQGLDEATREEIIQLLEAVLPPSTLTVLVTHHREEAERLAGRVIRLSGPPLALEDRIP